MSTSQRQIFPNVRALAQAAVPPLVGTLVIDAEEDFDWNHPLRDTARSTEHLHDLTALAALFARHRAVPTFLVTQPVLQDEAAVASLRALWERGQCVLGLQLHPWVTPPFGEVSSPRNSYLTNLDANQEEQKLLTLKSLFERRFGVAPTIFRAGRYGLSRNTPHLLEKHGFFIDTSIAPRTNFSRQGGPDYRHDDAGLFWFGAQRRLLEVPLCRDVVGWGSRFANGRIGLSDRLGPLGHAAGALFARTRCAERITLSPEGNDVGAMQRLLRGLLARGQGVFSLSFHSSSLSPGRNPYVRDEAGQRVFIATLDAALAQMGDMLPGGFAPLDRVPFLLDPTVLPPRAQDSTADIAASSV